MHFAELGWVLRPNEGLSFGQREQVTVLPYMVPVSIGDWQQQDKKLSSQSHSVQIQLLLSLKRDLYSGAAPAEHGFPKFHHLYCAPCSFILLSSTLGLDSLQQTLDAALVVYLLLF